MTRCRVENLSDGPRIVHGPFFYINTEFETGGAGIWKKKLNLGTPNVYTLVICDIADIISAIPYWSLFSVPTAHMAIWAM